MEPLSKVQRDVGISVECSSALLALAGAIPLPTGLSQRAAIWAAMFTVGLNLCFCFHCKFCSSF
jgi:hypothetical protein